MEYTGWNAVVRAIETLEHSRILKLGNIAVFTHEFPDDGLKHTYPHDSGQIIHRKFFEGTIRIFTEAYPYSYGRPKDASAAGIDDVQLRIGVNNYNLNGSRDKAILYVCTSTLLKDFSFSEEDVLGWCWRVGGFLYDTPTVVYFQEKEETCLRLQWGGLDRAYRKNGPFRITDTCVEWSRWRGGVKILHNINMKLETILKIVLYINYLYLFDDQNKMIFYSSFIRNEYCNGPHGKVDPFLINKITTNQALIVNQIKKSKVINLGWKNG